MANHKSAKKRAEISEKRRDHARTKKSEAKTEIKKLRDLIAENKVQEAKEQLVAVQSKLAKLAKGSILHRNTASRKTSRLAQQVAKIAK